MRKLVCIAIFILAAVISSHAQSAKINFTPESEKFTAATKEYQAIWQSEGDKMIKAMEKISGLKFKETEFDAIVFEGVSFSGRPGVSPMKMRASYTPDTKKATLVHEIGHRHISQLQTWPKDLDAHQILFLILYDIWVELYGEKFANEQVEIEKSRRGPYPAAWKFALSMTKKERENKFREIVKDSNIGQNRER